MSGFVFTACENKGRNENEAGSDNETTLSGEISDTNGVAGRDSLGLSTTDTTYDPTSDTMYKRR